MLQDPEDANAWRRRRRVGGLGDFATRFSGVWDVVCPDVGDRIVLDGTPYCRRSAKDGAQCIVEGFAYNEWVRIEQLSDSMSEVAVEVRLHEEVTLIGSRGAGYR